MNVRGRALPGAVVAVVVLVVGLLGAGSSGAAVREGPVAVRAAPLSAPAYGSGLMVTGPRVNGLRLRSRASFQGYVKGLLYRGDRVRVVGWQGPWVEVQVVRRSASGLRAGTLGWSWRRYLYRPAVCPSSVYVCRHW